MKSKLLKKIGVFFKSLGMGILNGNPITAPFTPSIQELAEQNKKADLNEDGNIGKLKQNNVNVYYITSLIGVIIGVASTIYISVWGLKNGLTQDQIEWIISNIQKIIP